MSKFKAGDKVVVRNSDHDLLPNGTYTVDKVVNNFVTIKKPYGATKENFNVGGWLDFRFELAVDLKVNGVDAEGNPKQLNDSDLKPMQRAILGDGRTAIITRNVNDTLVFVFEQMQTWCSASVEYPLAKLQIEKLYDIPYWTASILDFNTKGDLLWERKKVDVVLKQLTEAVEQAEQEFRDSMDYTVAKVKAAKQALEEYKAN